ncbi:MAG: bifunctional UDP-2,4-diacetamido-2,4,6-trideoxy-beta-L-altropyranose hydrolase/GNAT family N-acetyltransferase [Nitrospiraceae bacterium]|nr:bifunctional UDP-2,4-diacetamido-2,4,6-trideoxy-beta-L-altropyranose hydrolase/GNAT family N-acetyltransferase [Nitrospiraceae bacterium]
MIITEGGAGIGNGHISRCTSLYEAFEEKGIVPELVINGDETYGALLRDKNYLILDWLKERKRLHELTEGADVAVIDSYLGEPDFYRDVSSSTGVGIYMDDYKRMDYPSGIVVNGSIGAEDLHYPRKEGITYLLGPRYIPLRRAFRYVPEKTLNERVKGIVVTLGGNDARNITPGIMRTLHDNHGELTKTVIIGPGFRNREEIEREADSRTTMMYCSDAEEMKALMFESDIAISAGGQTLYELARVGVPAIAVAVADNQMDNIGGWQKAGFVEYAGRWEDKEVLRNISDKVEALEDIRARQRMSQIGRSVVDGKGAQRIVARIRGVFTKGALVVRRAEVKDMSAVFELSNDPEIRRNSFHEEGIGLDDHRLWFAGKLSSTDCVFLVAEAAGVFIGQVRFDVTGEEAVISLGIGSDFRGLGLGQDILQKAIVHLKAHLPAVTMIRAYIKVENFLSVKFFERARFRFVRKRVLHNQNALEYVLHV